MKKTIKIMIVTICVSGCLLSSAMARMGGRHGGMCGFPLWRLDLTDAQKTSIAGILSRYEGRFESQRIAMEAAREEMDMAMDAETLDEAAVRSASQAVSEVMAEMAVLRAKVKYEIAPILTADQLEKLKGIKAEREAMHHYGRGRHQEMMKTWLEANQH
ncbi:MAG: hypothetical protein CSA22_09975 [Deltaproteobacteria bacterium]|nr:MAG: hypothetical protein CSA22_09975 [Deltaproteobacteria bacterium]